MKEIGRGAPAFESAPVQGLLRPVSGDGPVPGPRPGAPGGGTPPQGWSGAAGTGGGVGPAGVVALLEEATAGLPDLEDLVAVVCTAGAEDAPLATAARAAGLPCVLGVTFDGGPPAAGTLVLVDCSKGGEGIVEVVDGGAATG